MIDAQANLCPVDDQVCCTPKKDEKDTKFCKTKPQHIPTCGRRNLLGSGLRIINPVEGKEATQFGEWPHACILFRKTPNERDDLEFIGGASLIAPGIVITAAHKLLYNGSGVNFNV